MNLQDKMNLLILCLIVKRIVRCREVPSGAETLYSTRKLQNMEISNESAIQQLRIANHSDSRFADNFVAENVNINSQNKLIVSHEHESF